MKRAAAQRIADAFSPSEWIWLDHAATSRRPTCVLRAMEDFYRESNANVRRGVHHLGATATKAYEDARVRTAAFLGGVAAEEVIFTHGTTESINMLVSGLVEPDLSAGDEVWVSAMEHHANFLPWQRAAVRKGAVLRIIPLTPEGRLDLVAFQDGLCSGRPRWVAVTWVSHVLGVVNPVEEICAVAHKAGARVLVDGAQGVSHMPVQLPQWDCDFFAFSGHKMFGPMGIGVLWGRSGLLEKMEPLLLGGEMVEWVTDEAAAWAAIPDRFEGGTPHIAGAVGLGAAMDFMATLSAEAWQAENDLVRDAAARLREVAGVKVWGPDDGRCSIVSFTVDGMHPHDIAQVLDAHKVEVRAGHMCAQPLLRRLGVPAVSRASFAPYNQPSDVDALLAGVRAAQKLFA